jgi:hypothetical protein
MDQKDSEYILWLCKRLVYKHNEDPKILIDIEKILEKNKLELGFYRQTHCSISRSIELAVQNLQEIKNNYHASVVNTKKNFVVSEIEKTNKIFENLDLKLLG